VVRNGQIVTTSGGATWTLSNGVLWSTQDQGWGIVTSGIDGAATLQHNTFYAGSGECHHVGATIEASAPPSAPSYSPAPSYSTSDAVPITVHNRAIHIIVTIGSNEPANMLLDTGATYSSLSPQVANRLVTSGQAVELGTSEVTLADNSTREVRVVGVYSLTIGRHVLYKVLFSVADDDEGEMLLGLDTLQRIGKFSIDSANGLLTFG
jgi:predicted aspartyl protease